MILIADSGSTKTQWALINSTGEMDQVFGSSGINPFLMSEDEIRNLLGKEVILPKETVSKIYFYGAGCSLEMKPRVENALQAVFQTEDMEVHSDLLGAARASCGQEEGIACILGTGSNSAYYDGEKIVRQTPSLGFILGDEGSGCHLGKRLISDLLKSQLSEEISKAFHARYVTDQAQVLERVYRQAFPNRFLAQFAVFLHENIHYPEIKHLVADCFRQFIHRNLLQYPDIKILPVHFTGSIAWFFKEILQEVLKENQLHVGKIRQHPMEGLIEYHSLSIS